jgi:hypothetical protein
MASSLALITLPGCVVGYNSALFYAESNIGLDAETKPPKAEISVAPYNGVIEPVFEGGQTPPHIASFQSHTNAFSRFFFGVQSTFAGGDAANALAQGPAAPSSALCLSEQPQTPYFVPAIPSKGEVIPFAFGAETVFGLKVAWTGTAGPFPDSLRLGFNRKELAWAPLFGTDASPDCTIPGTTQKGKYVVQMPSFLATLDTNGESSPPADSGQSGQPANNSQSSTPGATGVTWLQYFATGTAATTLAGRNDVRKIMLQQAFPPAAKSATGTYNPSALGDKIASFWMPDGKTINQNNQTTLLSCMTQDNNYPYRIPYLIAVGPETDRVAVATCAGVPK